MRTAFSHREGKCKTHDARFPPRDETMNSARAKRARAALRSLRLIAARAGWQNFSVNALVCAVGVVALCLVLFWPRRATEEFIFVFGTGRSGTQHLSRVLAPPTGTYVTHEEEHLSARTRTVVDREYRRLSAGDRTTFTERAVKYVKKTKLPFYRALMAKHNATRLVYTGHLPLVFGLAPALLDVLPRNSVRILRLRRDRFATAVSLMALGPEEEDPWGPTAAAASTAAASVARRWFPQPIDAMTRLTVSQSAWRKMNRFQRWLWYVDDVECRWQSLKDGGSGSFEWMEASLEGLGAMDGGAGWAKIAAFMGVGLRQEQVGVRDNSIENKRRAKIETPESTLREWDMEYRKLVGSCNLPSGRSYSWSMPDVGTVQKQV